MSAQYRVELRGKSTEWVGYDAADSYILSQDRKVSGIFQFKEGKERSLTLFEFDGIREHGEDYFEPVGYRCLKQQEESREIAARNVQAMAAKIPTPQPPPPPVPRTSDESSPADIARSAAVGAVAAFGCLWQLFWIGITIVGFVTVAGLMMRSCR